VSLGSMMDLWYGGCMREELRYRLWNARLKDVAMLLQCYRFFDIVSSESD
jgi:hypothetical protein